MNHKRLALTNVAYDSFTDADATLLTAHTSERGGSWTKAGSTGAGTIQGNKAQIVDVLNNATFWTKAVPVKKKILTCTLDITVSGDGGVIFRFIDTSNFWQVDLNSVTNSFNLNKVVATVFTAVATVAFAPGIGTVYPLVLTDDLFAIKAQLGGGPCLGVGDGALASGANAGIFSGGSVAGGTLLVDNFRVDVKG